MSTSERIAELANTLEAENPKLACILLALSAMSMEDDVSSLNAVMHICAKISKANVADLKKRLESGQ